MRVFARLFVTKETVYRRQLSVLHGAVPKFSRASSAAGPQCTQECSDDNAYDKGRFVLGSLGLTSLLLPNVASNCHHHHYYLFCPAVQNSSYKYQLSEQDSKALVERQ